MRTSLISIVLFLSSQAFPFFQTHPEFYDLQAREEIGSGVTWSKLNYKDLYSSKQVINVVTIDLRKAQVLPIQKKGCQKISKTAKSQKALAAINGGFFKSGCVSRNFLKLDDKVYSYNVIRSKGSAALLIDDNGLVDIRMIKADENPKEALHGIGGFPLLVSDNKVSLNPFETTSFFTRRHPRTAVATRGPHELLFITVDGRSSQSRGLTLHELAEFMLNLGADSAMNLDGGGSTMMWTHSEGIVNTPSDGKERSVSDGLAVY